MGRFLIVTTVLLITCIILALLADLHTPTIGFYITTSLFFTAFFTTMLWRDTHYPILLTYVLWLGLQLLYLPASEPILLLIIVPFLLIISLAQAHHLLLTIAAILTTLLPIYLPPQFSVEETIGYTLLVMAIGGFALVYGLETTKVEKLEQDLVEIDRENRRLRRNVASQETAVREEERLRIARDIHDSVGHQLTALLMQAGILKRSMDQEDKRKLVVQIEQTAGDALEQTREAVRQIRSEELPGGIHAVIHLLRKLERESQMTVQWRAEDGFLSVPFTNDQQIAIYRFAQEGMTNAMKHGRTRQVELHVFVRGGRQAVLRMKNSCSEETNRPAGNGLIGMQERFEQLQGSFKWDHQGDVFEIEAVFPIERSESR
ncbi:hypothetical protein FLK61_26685 [Paenalkalicoccus suaedae]|uniref:histidine kinase n=1 Tax=Paenalkalicoccus suaedae TaxID=2592382 RepID=A0A859FCP1_9BACI|nr:histidine kinase [Paenalkalicoccus suaedae]QKS70344.1 hypothetical protein FLK61_26685 [Paenalkalicoccus suaedae]